MTCLRAGFFENLYIAPTLIGEDFYPQPIWYRSAGSEPQAAADYVTRYGRLWREMDDSLLFLREIWNDPLVRRELQSFLNLSKAILQAPDDGVRGEYVGETEWFTDLRRIQSTQTEILGRLQANSFSRPLERPGVAAICLAARDPARTVEFFRRLLNVEPVRTSRRARGYAEFELPAAGAAGQQAVRIAIHGHDRQAAGDPYRLGPPPALIAASTRSISSPTGT